MLGLLMVLLLLATQQGYCSDLVRLVNGGARQVGRVEVFVNGEWGTVCDDGFGLVDANVICRMLGYSRAIVARSRAHFGQGSGKIWVDQLDCKGDEDSIFDCGMNELGKHDCEHKEDAGVECYREVPKQPASLPVRLICPYNKECNNTARKRGPDIDECDPQVHVEGIVQVYYDDSWQFISADGWDDDDIDVVCGELGYPLAFGTVSDLNDILPGNTKVKRLEKKKFNEKLSKVLMKDVECSGTERELKLCYHYGWGPHDNPSGKVATARCGFKPHSSCNSDSKQHVSAYNTKYHFITCMSLELEQCIQHMIYVVTFIVTHVSIVYSHTSGLFFNGDGTDN